MPDFIKLNGTAVRTTGLYRRTIPHASGVTLAEVELVIIVRGSMANRSLKQLLSKEPIRIDIPSSTETESFVTSIENVMVGASGTGEAAAYRFDLTLRETPESAANRKAERAAVAAAAPPPPRSRTPSLLEVTEDPDAPLDLSGVTVSGDSAVWATALKQLTTPPSAKPTGPPETPLTTLERAGIEATLVNLRMDAVIDLLESSGLVRRLDVERQFMTLVKNRFVAEVTPLVGEKIAKRAERDLLG